jgi:hypothetical protein
LVAEEPSASPTRALAAASGGIVTSVNAARPIPTQLTSGSSPPLSERIASTATYAAMT